MTSDERFQQIDSVIDKIRNEKPYDDHHDAIAALDWLTSAASDLRKVQQDSEDTGVIASLQDRISTVERLHASVVASMKRSDNEVPGRHQ